MSKVIEKHDVTLIVEEVDNTISCGLRQDFLNGESQDGSVKFNMTCGAGLGTPWIAMSIDRDGVERHFRVDVRTLMSSVLDLTESKSDG